ncbi:cytoplasmic dynein 2 intermediate chain 2-like [Tubulanus polymorphus]|uniref:cytoplasmic dynein 2 intermediate chain 2-like n=1 Tax=Tubulanus polymorphus TaxID=672921 RepID=UPI003DA29EE6
MFNDESLDAIEIKSTWKRERSLAEAHTQTREIISDEIGIQSVSKANAQVQTDEQPEEDFSEICDDSDDLIEFLKKWEPYIARQLESNRRSHAFDGYRVMWEEQNSSVSCIHTLKNASLTDLEVTSLAWNCTGSVIAAAYGRYDHEDWCTHKSSLCFWNLNRRSLDADKPEQTVDLSSCLMCISFHPNQPALIAGGTFNGEVIVWDTANEDDIVAASSGIGDDSHREPVSKVHWVKDLQSKTSTKYNLVSVSGDGKMLTWQLNLQKRKLNLIEGHILLTESLPRSTRTQQGHEMGVTCISFSRDDKSTFLVGSECGGLFKCSMRMRGTPAGSHIKSSVMLTSPVTFSYDTHTGPVYSVDCSPFHRNLFVSCGSDSSARLYSMLLSKPIMTFEPSAGYLFSAHWSPVRPMVIAMVSESGHLIIYDLELSNAPKYKLEASANKSPVFTLQFNNHLNRLLATGGADGCIKIWQLSNDLTTQIDKEEEKFNQLADSFVD